MMKPTPSSTGGTAFAGLILFIIIVYANPGSWLEGLEDYGFAKIAAALTVAALGGAWLLHGRKLHAGGVPGAALIGLFALVGFSSLWSYWPKMTLDTFSDGVKYLAMFLVVANVVDGEDRLRKIVGALAWASLIPAVGCIVSWLRGEHLVDNDRAAWIGIFGNPNDLAYHLVVGVAMALGAREATRSRWLRIAYVAILVPLGVALLLTKSRGGMLAGGAVLLLWTLRSVRRAPALVGVAIALGCVIFLSPNNPWKERAESSVVHGVDLSAQGRIDAWRTGLEIAYQRPWTGVGAGAFVVAWPDFAPGDAGEARTEHNTFIQLVGELGIPGLLLFLVAFGAGVLGLSRAATVPTLAGPARGIQCGLAGFAVCSLSGGLAFTWPLYLLLGISVATQRLVSPAALRGPVVLVAEAR
jgi:O-antigen ligase